MLPKCNKTLTYGLTTVTATVQVYDGAQPVYKQAVVP
jgi:hypothetical protein